MAEARYVLKYQTSLPGRATFTIFLCYIHPTSALAVLKISGPWRSVGLGGAALVAFHIPR